jgi:hypothetical protein
MSKIVFAVSVAVLILIIDALLSIGTLTPTSAVAGSAPAMMTGAKGLPTSPYDDYEIVVD